MQYNIEEFHTIIHHVKEMNIQSEKGIVYSEPFTLILFDLYFVLTISLLNDYFKVEFSDIHNNLILKYTSKFVYKSKNKDINKLIDKRFNQIINLWEVNIS